MANFRFSVIIVYSKTDSELMALVDSMANSDFDPLKDELLVVSDKKQVPLKLPVRWIQADSTGVGSRKNQGLRAARGQLVLFLDDDVTIHKQNFFSRIAESFMDAHIVATGGHYESPAYATPASRAYNRILEIYLKTQTHKISLLGGNFCLRAGPKVSFDESRAYGAVEDVLMLHLQSYGRLVYRPEFSVLHNPRMNILNLIVKACKQGFNQNMSHGGPSLYLKMKTSFKSSFAEVLLIFTYHIFNKLARVANKLSGLACGVLKPND